MGLVVGVVLVALGVVAVLAGARNSGPELLSAVLGASVAGSNTGTDHLSGLTTNGGMSGTAGDARSYNT